MAFNHSWQTVLHPGQTDDFFKLDHPVEFEVGDHAFNPVNE